MECRAVSWLQWAVCRSVYRCEAAWDSVTRCRCDRTACTGWYGWTTTSDATWSQDFTPVLPRSISTIASTSADSGSCRFHLRTYLGSQHDDRYLALRPGCGAAAAAIWHRQHIVDRTAAAADGTGKRTDGRTDTRPLHRPCTAYYSGGSVSNKLCSFTV